MHHNVSMIFILLFVYVGIKYAVFFKLKLIIKNKFVYTISTIIKGRVSVKVDKLSSTVRRDFGQPFLFFLLNF